MITRRAAIWSLAMLLASGQYGTAQEVNRKRFGAWDASMQVDMMTDSVLARVAMSYAADSSALLIVACGTERILSLGTRTPQGDSLSTIRIRFDSNPAGPPSRMWEYSSTRRTPEFMQYLAQLRASPDPNDRGMAQILEATPPSSTYIARGSVAESVLRNAAQARQLRVELSAGGRSGEESLQSRFDLAGLAEALRWLSCA